MLLFPLPLPRLNSLAPTNTHNTRNHKQANHSTTSSRVTQQRDSITQREPEERSHGVLSEVCPPPSHTPALSLSPSLSFSPPPARPRAGLDRARARLEVRPVDSLNMAETNGAAKASGGAADAGGGAADSSAARLSFIGAVLLGYKVEAQVSWRRRAARARLWPQRSLEHGRTRFPFRSFELQR